jgi:primosomal protein N' (replication factor Y) (superfamily II helicase)
VLVQTMNPEHPVLKLVAAHDFNGMYNEEIEKRKQFFYPPFSRIINIHFRHKERDVVFDAAHVFAQDLESKYGSYLVGPAEPVVNRVRNLFLMELLIKLPRSSELINRCKQDLLKECSVLHNNKRFARVAIIPDVDPL